MENIIENIQNVDQFMEAYDITQKKARKFELARKNLAKVLFDLWISSYSSSKLNA